MFSLPQYLFPQVPYEFIGSRAILQPQDVPFTSDYDYVFMEKDRQVLVDRLLTLEVELDRTPSGSLKFKVNLQNKEPGRFFVNGYNCIDINTAFVPNEVEYNAWISATKALRAIALVSPQEYRDKAKRIKVFNSLVQSFGGSSITSRFY